MNDPDVVKVEQDGLPDGCCLLAEQVITPVEADHIIDALGEAYEDGIPDGWNDTAQFMMNGILHKLRRIKALGDG